MTLNLNELQKLGAQARLVQLHAEQTAILEHFPDLRKELNLPPIEKEKAVRNGRPRRRAPMSRAARAAISKRMRNYWREKHRTAAQAAAQTAANQLEGSKRQVRSVAR